MARVQSEHLVLRRCIEILVELALRDQPNGQTPVDQMAWMELLAAAQAYLEATSRSEAVHHQVQPTAIKISDMYEIEAIDPPAEPPQQQPQAVAARITSTHKHSNRPAPATKWAAKPQRKKDYRAEHSTPNAANAARTHLPGIPAEVDEAAEQVFGVSASDIISVLFALGNWPLSGSEANAVVTDTGTVIRTLRDLLTFGSEPDGDNRIRSAASLLTSRPSDLKSADWRPWHARSRQRRLLVQPIAALRDDFAVIAPHFCMTSASVYLNYLTQGLLRGVRRRLPRRSTAPSRTCATPVTVSLKTTSLMLCGPPGTHAKCGSARTSAQRLGVPSLSGEIDIVAGRPGSRIIWLLEVKDPASVYVVPEIRRHLDRFYVTHGKDKAYADLLNAKLKDLIPHARAAATALRLPVTEDLTYEIRPIFVTRRPVPAAFAGGPIPFTTLQELARALLGR